jgi:hypothetical protein
MTRMKYISAGVEREPVPADTWAGSYGFKTSDVIRMIGQKQITGFRDGDAWFVLAPVSRGNSMFKGAKADFFAMADDAGVVEPVVVEALADDVDALAESILREAARQKAAAAGGTSRSWLQEWFSPRYDEVTLFVMSSSAILLFLLDTAFRSVVISEVTEPTDLRIYALLPFLAGGLALSLVQGFIRHEKREFEREMMLMFAVFFQAFSGIFAAFHLLVNPAWTIHWIFPFWNIISGILLLMMYRMQIVGIGAIIDTRVSRVQIAICILPVAGFIFFNHFVLVMHWSVILSMSVALAGVLSHAVDMFTVAHSE